MIGTAFAIARLVADVIREARESDGLNELRYRIHTKAREGKLDKSLARLVKLQKKAKQ